MVGFSSLNRYDLAVAGSIAGLLSLAYLIYPTEFVRVSVWSTIFMLFICYSGYLAYRWTFDE